MLFMIDDKLARFESQLERLVENVFASFFGRKVRAHDLALQLARAMETHAQPSTDADARPIAPDTYTIYLRPVFYTQITGYQNELQQTLSQHMVNLAMQTGYRLTFVPQVQFAEQDHDTRTAFEVAASFQRHAKSTTIHMARVGVKPAMPDAAPDAYLLIDSQRVVHLHKSVTNIGRQHDNDVIVDDPYVSRHHLQIRQRGLEFILFDVREQSGTLINGVLVKEHRLQSGDVVQVGKTVMVFMVDHANDDDPLNQTQPLGES